MDGMDPWISHIRHHLAIPAPTSSKLISNLRGYNLLCASEAAKCQIVVAKDKGGGTDAGPTKTIVRWVIPMWKIEEDITRTFIYGGFQALERGDYSDSLNTLCGNSYFPTLQLLGSPICPN